jgi:hypothetical protein
VRVLFSTPLHVMMHVWPGALSPHALALRPVPTVLIAGHTHLGMSADRRVIYGSARHCGALVVTHAHVVLPGSREAHQASRQCWCLVEDIPLTLNLVWSTVSCANWPVSMHVKLVPGGDRVRTSGAWQSIVHVLPTVTPLHRVVLRPATAPMFGHAHAGSCGCEKAQGVHPVKTRAMHIRARALEQKTTSKHAITGRA